MFTQKSNTNEYDVNHAEIKQRLMMSITQKSNAEAEDVSHSKVKHR